MDPIACHRWWVPPQNIGWGTGRQTDPRALAPLIAAATTEEPSTEIGRALAFPAEVRQRDRRNLGPKSTGHLAGTAVRSKQAAGRRPCVGSQTSMLVRPAGVAIASSAMGAARSVILRGTWRPAGYPYGPGTQDRRRRGPAAGVDRREARDPGATGPFEEDPFSGLAHFRCRGDRTAAPASGRGGRHDTTPGGTARVVRHLPGPFRERRLL